jgi:hypothetical protein
MCYCYSKRLAQCCYLENYIVVVGNVSVVEVSNKGLVDEAAVVAAFSTARMLETAALRGAREIVDN